MKPASIRRQSFVQRRSIIQEVPPAIAVIVMVAILAVVVVSAVPSAAPILPTLSLVLLVLAGVELVLARHSKSASAARLDIAAAFVFVSAVAATLSEPEHIIDAFGLTMPP